MGGSRSRPSNSTTEVPAQNVNGPIDTLVPYILGVKIGEGQFGTVHKAEHRTTRKVVAIKTLKILGYNEESEVKSLQKANHENIVKFLDYINGSQRGWIVLEFCEFGSLDKFLKQRRPEKTQRTRFIKDISAGLAYLHGIPIAHRDLKPANVLVDSRRVAKIADFGLAKVLMGPGSTGDVDKIYMGTTAGTFAYMAPEVLEGHYNLQADIFSMGLVFCATISEELKRETESKCLGVLMNANPHYEYAAPAGMDEFMQKLLTSMLQRDYHNRPKAHDVYQQLMQYTGSSQPKEPNLSIDTLPYILGDKIGEGHFGTVHRAEHRTTRKVVAIKTLKKMNDKEKSEVNSLQEADHENIVKLVDFINDSEKALIVLEFCEFGSLENFLKQNQPTETQRIKFIKNVSAGLAYLHGIPIVHRDLKPANVLVDSKRVAKIADFGLAKILIGPGSTENVEKIYMDTAAGTIAYMAPEVLKRHYNLQADIFSMGLVFCATLSEELRKDTEGKFLGVLMNANPLHQYTAPAGIDDFMQKLLSSMLQRDYHDRPKAHDVHQQLMQYGAEPKEPNLSSTKLVAAGISACLGVRVLLPEECTKLPGHLFVKKLTIHDLFHFTNPSVMSVNGRDGTEVGDIDIVFKSTGGSTGVLGISSDATVSDLRRLISLNAHLPEDYLQLIHRSCRIENENPISQEGIGHGSVVHVHSAGEAAREVVYEMDESLLDRRFNYDFTNQDDGDTEFIRGGHVYQRPCGWYRHAIKVKGQYEDDVWLGDDGIRTSSTFNEWPVSYHGSKMRNSNIAIENSDANGVESVLTTPSLNMVADKFAKTFLFEGNTYQIALQNRINPDDINGHMVVIPGEDVEPPIDYWLSPKQDPYNNVYDVRPYGILIRMAVE
ncbi:uncharacterized protein LOC117121726 [Anneissia japonica]|uniref:uncharacterized protein LOC117121726 n=1 Tax=Anneissia japonica TaxID=1529436 RepID=UPI0014259C8B|nr:uncharacterized protein LOC117121726 [Anneissia japonica]